MIKEKRFLPVEYHEPIEEDPEFYMEEGEKESPKKKTLYVAS